MRTRATAFVILNTCAAAATAQPAPPDYGFDFVTIGDVGNQAYVGDEIKDEFFIRGRGSVNYEYRIARTEIRTADWVEFVDAVRLSGFDRTDFPIVPRQSGGTVELDPVTREEIYVQVLGREDWPVAGISWRAAAVYCNWLHNGKEVSIHALSSGAYDVSTFGENPDTGRFTDQDRRSPGARYWIPSLDEWLKAVHYDPNRFGPDQGGYWTYPNSSDTKPVAGVPGVGETNADLIDQIGDAAWGIPVGSYPQTQTPWGLLDDWLFPGKPFDRLIDGASVDVSFSDFEQLDPDRVGRAEAARLPGFSSLVGGLRIASAVPAPSNVIVMAGFGLLVRNRSRR